MPPDGDYFGTQNSIAISNNYIIIGAPRNFAYLSSDLVNNTGSVYIFERDNSVCFIRHCCIWTKL